MSAKAGSGVSVMRSDLDASTSTEVDAHEAQCRAGVNRQARPDAASQRRAASLAAAANGWVVGLEGRSTLSLCSERALNLAPAPSRAQT